MLDLETLLPFLLAATILVITPGPDTFLILGVTSHRGMRHGFATMAGIISGGFFHATIFALGFAQVLNYSPTIFYTIKSAGAIYLIWLGISALRSAFQSSESPEHLAEVKNQGELGRSYFQGLLTNILNPKIAIFYLAFLPQFMKPDDPVAFKSVILIMIHYGIGLIWLGLLVLFVAELRAILVRPKVRRTFDGVIGVAFCWLGAGLLISGKNN